MPNLNARLSNALPKLLTVTLFCLALTGCQIPNTPSNHSTHNTVTTQNLGKGNSVIETFHIAPNTQNCMFIHAAAHNCLVVNGENFYDTIDGFDFESGYAYKLNVKKTQHCDPDIFNDCPQDIGIYNYELVDIINKEKMQ